MTLSTLREAEGDCWWKPLCVFRTGPFVIQSMTLSSVWSPHLLTLNWVLLCQTCWSHCSRACRMVLWPRLALFRGKGERSVHRQRGHGRRLIITQHSNRSRGVLLSAANSPRLYRMQPNIVWIYYSGEGRMGSSLINMVLQQTKGDKTKQ